LFARLLFRQLFPGEFWFARAFNVSMSDFILWFHNEKLLVYGSGNAHFDEEAFCRVGG